MNNSATYRYVVRCGINRSIFSMNSRTEHKRGDQVIARSNRGLELGEVLCEITPQNEPATAKLPIGSIQRAAGPDELATAAHLKQQTIADAAMCQSVVDSLALSMRIIDVERIFGGELITIYFTAAERVDFRELVKKLAGKYHARIEMRQIGARDEAKLLGDYGDCGRPLCCSGYLHEMPPVTMRMAKLQKATLDPNKLSGRCGRLKCCLRYENDHYEELASKIPPPGSEILTREGKARVINVELLAQQMLIVTEDNRRILITPEECLSVTKRGAELMNEHVLAMMELLAKDQRYHLDAYQFVREALAYAQRVMKMEAYTGENENDEGKSDRHLTGQQLCQAIREYALDQYGALAKTVLNSWGVHTTSDFGEIVYNLIRIREMRKSKSDRRQDFDDQYDFDEAFPASL